jgi:hypothetical protein
MTTADQGPPMPSEFSLSLGYELDPRAGHQLAATATSSHTKVVSSEARASAEGVAEFDEVVVRVP